MAETSPATGEPAVRLESAGAPSARGDALLRPFENLWLRLDRLIERFLPTALNPHGVPFRDRRLVMASLDHSVWMHRPFRADEWLLYAMDSPVAAGARGFTRGAIYARDGRLVASVAQEGLMRLREPQA